MFLISIPAGVEWRGVSTNWMAIEQGQFGGLEAKF